MIQKRNPSWQRLLAASLWTTILSHHSRNISSFVSRYSYWVQIWHSDVMTVMHWGLSIYLSIYPSVYLYTHKYGLPLWLSSKESTCNAGDVCSIPGLGRSLGEGYGNPVQHSCLENPMDGGAWQAIAHTVTKSWTGWKQLSMHVCKYTYTIYLCININIYTNSCTFYMHVYICIYVFTHI